MSFDGFDIFWLPFCEENQIMFMLASMKIVPVAVFRKLVLAFQWPPMTLKVVPQASCDPENCSESPP
jgi:hypothetical protein